ncbi:hypothetical protein P3L10_010954 [Capsicum annuum]
MLARLHELLTPNYFLSGVRYVGALLGFDDLLKKKEKKGFEKMLNSNTFVISCSVSLRWLVCGILSSPSYHAKSKKGLIVSNKDIKSDLMDKTKSQEIESLKEENLRLRQQMMKMYRVWTSGLPPPPQFPTVVDAPQHALESIPRQIHLNTFTTLSLTRQYKPTTFTAPLTVGAYVAQSSTEASILTINPMIVFSQSITEFTFNTVNDHCYTIDPTIKLSGPPKFLTKKPSMPEKMVGKVKSVENDMKSSPRLVGYEYVLYKNWGISSGGNLPPRFETSKFGEPDG